MFRKVLSFGGMLLLAGATVFVTPGLSLAQRGGGRGGGGGGHFVGGGGGHFGGGYHGGGYHGGGYHGGGYHGGGYRGGYLGGNHYGSHRYGYSRYGYYGYYPYSYGVYPYSYSSPVYDSGYYGSYGDVTPSYPDIYSSVTPAAASYPSLDPVATAPTQPDTNALVTVNVPAGAELWFDGKATTTAGSVRQFESPPLTPGSHYSYEVRARWNENGHEVTQTQHVEFSAGEHVSVTFPVQPTKASTAPSN